MNKSAKNQGAPAKSREDYEVSVLSRTMGYERYFGVLRVVRRRDRRVIFPFDGAPELGPFQSKDEAINAAREYGEKLIADDISTPEP